MEINWESPKEEVRVPTRQPAGGLARPPPGRARHPPGCRVAPLGAPFRLYNPLGWKPLKKSCFRVSPPPRGGNLQRRKAISGGQIPPGRSPPGRGDHLPEGEIVAI